MTDFIAFPIPTQVVDIQETPKAAALPKARLGAPHIARGWVDPVAACPPGSVISIPDYLPTPDGWWDFGAAASGLRTVCNWTPEALRTESTDARDLTFDPKQLFTDAAGTIPVADPGATIAALRDSQGRLLATQATSAARPVFGRHPARGKVNQVPNNSLAGAVVGVIGSGGAYPTGWALGGTVDIQEIVAIGTEEGRPYIDVRYSSASSTGNIALSFLESTIPAANGQTWTSSVYVRRVAGAMTGITTVLLRNLMSDGVGGAYQATANINTEDNNRTPLTHTMSDALLSPSGGSIIGFRPRIAITDITGAFDITLRISGIQSEQAGAAVVSRKWWKFSGAILRAV